MNTFLFTLCKNNQCAGITSAQIMVQERHRLYIITQCSILSSCPTIQNIIAPRLTTYMHLKSLHHLEPSWSVYQKFSCISPICCRYTIHHLLQEAKDSKLK